MNAEEKGPDSNNSNFEHQNPDEESLHPQDETSEQNDEPPITSKDWNPGMLRGDFLRQWSSEVAQFVASQELAKPRDGMIATKIATKIYAGADFAMQMSSQCSGRKCKAGCSDCCHVMIGVTPPEALAIADFILTRYPAELSQRIKDRVSQVADKTQSMGHWDYAKASIRCSLLSQEDNCLVYEVRPLRCRGWNSLSLDQCIDCHLSGSIGELVPVDAHAFIVGQGASAGLSAAIAKAGLSGESFELNSILTVALNEPNAGTRWAEGEELFAACNEYY